MRTISLLMLLSGALCGCAYVPVSSPQLDARTLCQEQAQASASAPEASNTQKYFDQCMIAKSKENPKAGHERTECRYPSSRLNAASACSRVSLTLHCCRSAMVYRASTVSRVARQLNCMVRPVRCSRGGRRGGGPFGGSRLGNCEASAMARRCATGTASALAAGFGLKEETSRSAVSPESNMLARSLAIVMLPLRCRRLPRRARGHWRPPP